MFNIGERLTQLRKSRNLTQKEVADLLGVSKRAYQNYEYNHNMFTIEIMIRYLNAMKMTAAHFLGREDVEASYSSDVRNPMSTSTLATVADELDRLEKMESDLAVEIKMFRERVKKLQDERILQESIEEEEN